jgi:hypothetical protein
MFASARLRFDLRDMQTADVKNRVQGKAVLIRFVCGPFPSCWRNGLRGLPAQISEE